MGDRCWLGLTLHGDIESPYTLVRALRAIIKEGLNGDGSEEATVRELIEYLSADLKTQFYSHEVNYANIEDCEEELQECGVAYSVSHEAGGDYSAACWTWTPVDGKTEAYTSQGDLMLTVDEVKRALTEGSHAGVLKLIADTEMAEGKNLPPLSFSGRAERMVARVMGLKALKAAE